MKKLLLLLLQNFVQQGLSHHTQKNRGKTIISGDQDGQSYGRPLGGGNYQGIMTLILPFIKKYKNIVLGCIGCFSLVVIIVVIGIIVLLVNILGGVKPEILTPYLGQITEGVQSSGNIDLQTVTSYIRQIIGLF